MPKKDVVKLNLKTNFSQSFDYSLFINDSTRLSVGIIEKHDLTEFLKTNSTINFYNVLKGKVDITHQQTSNIETFQVGESFIITQFNDLQWAVYNDTQLIYLTYELDTLNQIDELESNKIIPINKNNSTPWQKTSDGFKKKLIYSNHNKKFTAGVWLGKAFKTDFIDFPYNEFIFINEGSLVCTDENNIDHVINSGESLLIPQGVKCSWQSFDIISIHFVQIKQ